jgi:hypothetical protein
MKMVTMKVLVDGDGCWPDLIEKRKAGNLVETREVLQVAGLSRGMASGKPSVSIRIDLPDGKTVFAETSLALFLSAADILKARYGDPRD